MLEIIVLNSTMPLAIGHLGHSAGQLGALVGELTLFLFL